MAHRIAANAAAEIIREASAHGMLWSDVAVTLQTTVGLIIAHCAEMMVNDGQSRLRLAEELTKAVCEGATAHAVKALRERAR